MIGANMGDLSNSSDRHETVLRLEHYEVYSDILRCLISRPIMTNGQCRVTMLKRGGAMGDRFKYEETWIGSKIEFEFEGAIVGDAHSSTTYQVFLYRALDQRPDYWTNEFLNHLMANIRQAIRLLRNDEHSEKETIKIVEFGLSRLRYWKHLVNFQSKEVVL
jgi:hypothetical protein